MDNRAASRAIDIALEMVLEARAEERERCAKVAERMNYGGETEYDKGRRAACEDIAAAIRNG